jgi:hypothetical protein
MDIMKAETKPYSFIRSREGKVVLWQNPNFALWAWLVLTIIARVVSNGQLHEGFQLTARAFLFAWAYMEIRTGESPFRQLLGGVVFAGILASFFEL